MSADNDVVDLYEHILLQEELSLLKSRLKELYKTIFDMENELDRKNKRISHLENELKRCGKHNDDDYGESMIFGSGNY
jgi:DNA polymerase sigma